MESDDQEEKPDVLNVSGRVQSPSSDVMTDYINFELSDSIPRLYTDSSSSEHVVSSEFTSEVQSQPRLKEEFSGFTFNYLDASLEDSFYSQFPTLNQMSPLQDMFMYLQKPF